MKPLRRTDRRLDEIATYNLLTNGLYGVLATVDTAGQPHATPLNYAHVKEGDEHVIYIHAATAGQKLDNIKHEPRVAFTIVGHTKLLSAEFSIEYQSVMLFGTISLVEDPETKQSALKHITDKYSPEHAESAELYINRAGHTTTVLRLLVEHISGKHRKG